MSGVEEFKRAQLGAFGQSMVDFAGRQAFATIFGEAEVASRSDDISAQFQYDNSPNDLDIQDPVGGGQLANIDSMMSVETDGIGEQTVYSVDSVRYRPGHQGYDMFTAIFEGAGIGAIHRIGMGNGADQITVGTQDGVFGFWFQEGENDPVFTSSAQFSVDRVDGEQDKTNPSGFKLDLDSMNIFYIVYGWLGIAPISIYVHGGASLGWLLMHIRDDTNKRSEPHLKNPTLPMIAEVVRTSGTGLVALKTSSWRAGSVAGQEEDNRSNRRFSSFVLDRAIDSINQTHLMTLRSKDIFKGKANHVKARVYLITAGNSTNKDIAFGATQLAALAPPDVATIESGMVDVNTATSVMERSTVVLSFSVPVTDAQMGDATVILRGSARTNTDVVGFDIYPGRDVVLFAFAGANATGEVFQALNHVEYF